MRPQDFKRWRKSLGLSQKEAAEALGLKRRVVQYYEKGERDGEKVKIAKTVRLACAALARGIEDYGGPQKDEPAAVLSNGEAKAPAKRVKTPRKAASSKTANSKTASSKTANSSKASSGKAASSKAGPAKAPRKATSRKATDTKRANGKAAPAKRSTAQRKGASKAATVKTTSRKPAAKTSTRRRKAAS